MNAYQKFFGIDRAVFVDGSPTFLPERHAALAERLASFCQNDQSLLLLTGTSGIGKSAVLRWLAANAKSHQDVVLTTLLKPESQVGWLAPRLAAFLGHADVSIPWADVMKIVASGLDQYKSQGRQLVVAIDAAHLIAGEGWQELLGLLNLGSLAGSCFSFVLVGSPKTLKGLPPEVKAKLSCHLEWPALSQAETQGYIAHYCQLAKLTNPFAEATYQRIYTLTKGMPSLIHALCENALIEAAQQNTLTVTPDIIKQAAPYVSLGERPLSTPPKPKNKSSASMVKKPSKPLSPDTKEGDTIPLASLFKPEDDNRDT